MTQPRLTRRRLLQTEVSAQVMYQLARHIQIILALAKAETA